MRDLIAAAATVVALAAATRSTWSPCGVSMLSSLTPLAEAGRGHRYASTAGWFVIGGALGGATLGAGGALLAFAVRAIGLDAGSTGWVALAAAVTVAVSDSSSTRLRLPYHRRQVNEQWLDRYRLSVYAAGFGWQIGTGLATYVTTAAVYLLVLLSALSASPVWAFLVCTLFGAARGVAVLLGRGITSPSRLPEFHRKFESFGPTARRGVVCAEVSVAASVLLWLTGSALSAVVVISGSAVLVTAVIVGAIVAVAGAGTGAQFPETGDQFPETGDQFPEETGVRLSRRTTG